MGVRGYEATADGSDFDERWTEDIAKAVGRITNVGLYQEVTANYIIFKVDSTYYRRDGETGLVDDSNADASTLIQDAIDALTVAGGKIYIKKGIYTLATGLSIQNHATYLEGEGFARDIGDQPTVAGATGLSVLKAAAGFTPGNQFITWGALAGGSVWHEGGIRGFMLDGNNRIAGDAVTVLNVHGMRILDNVITLFDGKGVHTDSDIAGGISNIVTERNLVRDLNDIGIHYDGGTDINFLRFNYISNVKNYGILSASTGNYIVGNHIETVDAVAGYKSGTGIYASGNLHSVLGNTIMACDYLGIYGTGIGTVINSNGVHGSNLNGLGDGAGIFVEGTSQIVINGNFVYDSVPNSIYGINLNTDASSTVNAQGNNVIGYTTRAIRAGFPDTIQPKKTYPFQFIKELNGTYETASPTGVLIDAATETAILQGHIPTNVNYVVRLRLFGVAKGAPINAGGQMHVELTFNAGAANVAYNTAAKSWSLTNYDGEEADYVADDVVTWAIVDGDVGNELLNLAALDSFELLAIYEAGADPDGATNAVFRSLSMECI